MGTFCENAIALSTKSLLDGNLKNLSKVTELTAEIKHKERNIEAMCMRLILQQQPVAKDLRVISSALKMVTDMERIGDNSGDIAEIIVLENISASDDKLCIQDMAQATIKMVTGSIDAFVKRDIELAKKVIEYDDIVDDYFNKMKKQLIELLAKQGTNAEYALDLLMIAKYFERIGDHACEIAKWVLYSITGKKEG